VLQEVIYTNDQEVLKVSVERCEVLLKSNEILNFPRIIELEGDRLILAYGRGRHGGAETRPVAISEDFGKTWVDAPSDFPMADNVQTSGIMGYLRDGTIVYIDVLPLNVKWSGPDEPYHHVAKVEDPIFRLRRFSKKAELLEDSTFKVLNLPWKSASYELYGTLLELENGNFLTAFQAQVGTPSETRCDFTTFVVRSSDGGNSFEHVWTFSPEIDGKPVGDQGLCEPDLAVLANGDILCMMRTGSGSPMYQSRSTDGGWTWSEPVSIGWQGVKPHLRLLSNGVLACSAGRGIYGHPQITHAMFSLDGTGDVWEYPFAFHTGPGCSYTSNMERDGKFYVVYSHSSFWSPAGTYGLPCQSIRWVILNLTLSD
jgi:hypothetical protein